MKLEYLEGGRVTQPTKHNAILQILESSRRKFNSLLIIVTSLKKKCFVTLAVLVDLKQSANLTEKNHI